MIRKNWIRNFIFVAFQCRDGICRGDHVRAQAQAPAASATSSVVARDPLGDLKFRNLGPAVAGGRVAAVAGVPGNPNVIYVGAAGGGVWKSTDGGISWRENGKICRRLRSARSRWLRKIQIGCGWAREKAIREMTCWTGAEFSFRPMAERTGKRWASPTRDKFLW